MHNVIKVFTRENALDSKIAFWLKENQEDEKGDSEKERAGILKASGTWRELVETFVSRHLRDAIKVSGAGRSSMRMVLVSGLV